MKPGNYYHASLHAAEPTMRLQPLLRAARRLVAARSEARRFVARAWLAAPLVRASLAVVGFQPTLRWIEATPPRRRGGPPDRRPVGVGEGRTLVGGAFRAHLVGGECLDQSLVQYLLHRRDGVAARLVLGVKRADSKTPSIAAHAWVEGLASPGPDGPEDPTFTPLFVGGGPAS